MKYIKLMVLTVMFGGFLQGAGSSSSSSSSSSSTLPSRSSSSSSSSSRSLDYSDVEETKEEVIPTPPINLDKTPLSPEAIKALKEFIAERRRVKKGVSSSSLSEIDLDLNFYKEPFDLDALDDIVKGIGLNTEANLWNYLVKGLNYPGWQDFAKSLIDNGWINSSGFAVFEFQEGTHIQSLLEYALTSRPPRDYQASYDFINLLLSKDRSLVNKHNINGVTPLVSLLRTNMYPYPEDVQSVLGKIQALLDNGAKINGVLSKEDEELMKENSALVFATGEFKKLLQDHLKKQEAARESYDMQQFPPKSAGKQGPVDLIIEYGVGQE